MVQVRSRRVPRQRENLDATRQDFRNFLDKDPNDLLVKETEFAGKGLFAARFFWKGELVCNYRGTRKTCKIPICRPQNLPSRINRVNKNNSVRPSLVATMNTFTV